jgi:hypothetical protein
VALFKPGSYQFTQKYLGSICVKIFTGSNLIVFLLPALPMDVYFCKIYFQKYAKSGRSDFSSISQRYSRENNIFHFIIH